MWTSQLSKIYRSNYSNLFVTTSILKILRKYSKKIGGWVYLLKQPLRSVLKNSCSENMQQFIGEHPCRSAISIELPSNFIEITLRHGCSPISLRHIFRAPFPTRSFGLLLLYFLQSVSTKTGFEYRCFFEKVFRYSYF